MIVPDGPGIPWWRLLWSLLGALLVATVGVVALMTDMNNPGGVQVMLELLALPFVRPVFYLLGWKSDTAILAAVIASFLVWWAVMFRLVRYLQNPRRSGAA